jgi:hypothetical protein
MAVHRKTHRIAALAFSLCALAPLARAQVRSGTFEISPFAGYLFGGSFPAGSNALFSSRVDVQDHFTYGGGIGYFVTSAVEIEGRFSRAETGFGNHHNSDQVFGTGSDGARLADLTIDTFMGYGTFHFGHRRAVPYVTLGFGAARLDPGPRRDIVCPPGDTPCSNPATSTRFTTAIGGGVKIYANRNFGFRFDARYYGIYLNSRRGDCDTFSHGQGSCSSGDRANWLGNVETTGGLVISF